MHNRFLCLLAPEQSFFGHHFYVESFLHNLKLYISIIILFTYWNTSSNILCKNSSTSS